MSVEIQDQRAPRLKRLQDALESGTLLRVHREVNSLHPAEIARLLESVDLQTRAVLWEMVGAEDEGDVLVELNDEVRDGLIEEMETDSSVASFTSAMTFHMRARVRIPLSCSVARLRDEQEPHHPKGGQEDRHAYRNCNRELHQEDSTPMDPPVR